MLAVFCFPFSGAAAPRRSLDSFEGRRMRHSLAIIMAAPCVFLLRFLFFWVYDDPFIC